MMMMLIIIIIDYNCQISLKKKKEILHHERGQLNLNDALFSAFIMSLRTARFHVIYHKK